jgi:hypothetical protein
MLTVTPSRRADIEKICSHWWVNEGHADSCLDIAEELANQTPVRLDLLLSLAPPPTAVGIDKILLTDEQVEVCCTECFEGVHSSLGVSDKIHYTEIMKYLVYCEYLMNVCSHCPENSDFIHVTLVININTFAQFHNLTLRNFLHKLLFFLCSI